MDDADRAEARIEEVLEDGLADVHRAMDHALPAVGACYYCHEACAAGLRFCDADCRDGWDYEQKLKRMQGVK